MRPLTGTDYREIWSRRKGWFLGTTFLVAAGTCLVAAVLPNQYTSTSLILLEGPAVSQNAVKAIESDESAEIQSLHQEIVSRTRLEPIIRRLRLVPQGAIIPDSVIDAVKNSIDVKIMTEETTGAVRKGPAYAFTVSFTASDPQAAREIDNELASFFVSQKLKLNEQKAQETQRFVEEQFNAATKDLLDKQGRLEAFKQRYRGQLPVDEQLVLQSIGRLQTEQRTIQQAIDHAQLGTPSTATSPEQATLTELKNHLQALEGHLADLQSRYTGAHPDVIKTKDEIARVRTQIDAEIADSSSESAKKANKNGPAQPKDAAQQADVAALRKEQKTVQEQIAQLEANLRGIPAHGQEYDELARDYEGSKANYDKLQGKLQESQLTSNVALGLQGGRFRVQDSASLPDTPSAPVRWKINLGGLAAAVLVGLVLAGGLEFADSTMKSDRDVEYYLEVNNLATVPEVRTATEMQSSTRKKRLWRFATSLVVLLLLAVLVYLYFVRK